MTKEQLIEKIGKNGFLDDAKTLAAKLNYESGISSFDEYLDGKTLKQIDAVIHLTKHPKGLAIKIAKNFSSFSFGLAFDEIERTDIIGAGIVSCLIFQTVNGEITFSIKPKGMSEVKQFLTDINLEFNDRKREVLNLIYMEGEKNHAGAYMAVVSSLFIVIGCFMPWIQLGALFKNRGIDNPDGAIMLVASVIAGAVAIFNLSKNLTNNKWVFTVVGIVGIIVAILDLNEVSSRVDAIQEGVGRLNNMLSGGNKEVSRMNFIGSGLYIVCGGSIGLILCGIGAFGSSTTAPRPDTTYLGDIAAPKFAKKQEKTEEEIENDRYRNRLIRLNRLIEEQKGVLFGGGTDDISNLISGLCKTQDEAIYLLETYEAIFHSNLIEELKKLANSYDEIKKNVSTFIKFGIIEEKYPHNLK